MNAFRWTQHSARPVTCKQSVSKDISCHPAHSRGFYPSVCWHLWTGTCQSATLVYLNRMNGTGGLRNGASLVPGRQTDNEAAASLLGIRWPCSIKDTGSQQIWLPPLCCPQTALYLRRREHLRFLAEAEFQTSYFSYFFINWSVFVWRACPCFNEHWKH